jgi:two-component system sensor histidine kinase KdpD
VYPITDHDEHSDVPGDKQAARPVPQVRSHRLKRYLAAAAASLLTAAIALPLLHVLDLANIVMLFLLTVVLMAVWLGRGAAVVATLVGVAAFDFFFVVPRFSFSVSDLQYLITFAVMMAVGLIIAHLTSDLRYQARVASQREARARALYEFSRELSGALQTEDIFSITRTFIQHTFAASSTLLLPDDAGQLIAPSISAQSSGEAPRLTVLDTGMAQWAFDNAAPCGISTQMLPRSEYLFLPLKAPMRTRGVLVIQPQARGKLLIPEQRQHLDTFATLAAIALERVHYVDVARTALVHVESEKLRNSVLSALSHDLRTPLTALVGLSESLASSTPPLSLQQKELAQGLRDVAMRMSTLVTNLLDMARIQSGAMKLNLQWQPIDEVIGSALRACEFQLKERKIETDLPQDLPLVCFDATLMERVLCNLLENAAKYTPPGALIRIGATVDGERLRVIVDDNGPGIPAGREVEVFEKFVRGLRESSTPGIGLGLSICRAIVQAHGGTIEAARSQEGGASLRFTLPLGTPPAMPELVESELHDASAAHG